MAANRVLNYIPKDSVIHRLTGTSKLIFFILFTAANMVTYDIRVFAVLLVFSVLFFVMSRISFRETRSMFLFLFIFLILNNLTVFLFDPDYGCGLYHSTTVLIDLGRYSITAEQLFYQLNMTIKYLIALPVAIIFIASTNPSEFASSLNRIGVSYKTGYSVALALRYIPDIQRDYHNISQSQQARGVELGRGEKFFKRLKNSAAILLPLIISSISRVDVIANAMELRGFGKNKQRTWYSGRPFKTGDLITVVLGAAILLFSILFTYADGERFYNPFG
jgi:energy-coupling factor transport system permease protein